MPNRARGFAKKFFIAIAFLVASANVYSATCTVYYDNWYYHNFLDPYGYVRKAQNREVLCRGLGETYEAYKIATRPPHYIPTTFNFEDSWLDPNNPNNCTARVRWTNANGTGFNTITASYTTSTPATCKPESPEYRDDRNFGPQSCPNLGESNYGNPINVASGNKHRRESDYEGSGSFPLRFERSYNSGSAGQGNIGNRWTHNYARSLVPLEFTVVRLVRPSGDSRYFTKCSSAWCATSDMAGSLTRGSTSWTYIDENDNTEIYDAAGKLQSIQNRVGIAQTFGYDGSGRLSTVTHSFGHQLDIGYDGSGRIEEVSLHGAGTIATYGYDTDSNLTSVENADLSSRNYLYDESSYSAAPAGNFLLTGIEDEDTSRFATYQYDSTSRAIASNHAGDGDIEVTYNVNGTTSTEDGIGGQRTYTFHEVNGLKRIASVTGDVDLACGVFAGYDYSVAGDLVGTTDFNGEDTSYTYNSRHLEEERVEAVGTSVELTTETQWHSTLRLPTQIDIPGRQITLTYDGSGNTLTRTETDTLPGGTQSRTWTWTYNSYGQVLTEDGPRTDVIDVTTYTYYSCSTGSECGRLETVTNAAGHVTSFDSYDEHGYPTEVTSANGTTTMFAFDTRQRLSAQCVGGSLPGCTGGELTSFMYWDTGPVKKVTNPDFSFLEFSYDTAQRLTRIEDSAGNYIEYTVDALGNRIEEEVRDNLGGLRLTGSRVYNALNQLYQEIGASSTGANTTSYAYDGNGNLTQITAPLSRVTSSVFDELNRLTQITDAESGLTSLHYDAPGNLVGITDPNGNSTTYEYDGLGNLLEIDSPDSGTTSNDYDSAGNLLVSTDARGAVAEYEYDELNRQISAEYALSGSPTQTLSYTYDQGTYGKGFLTGAADANHSMSWTIDSKGRLASTETTFNSITHTIDYTYTDGLRTSMTLPSGNVINYTYDSSGRVSSVALGVTTILNNVSWEPFGGVAGWTWGNSTTHSRTYDDDGRILAVDSSLSNGLNLEFGYDAANRITSIDDVGSSPIDWDYDHDDLDRLTGADGPKTITWTYDATGNRLSENDSALGSSTYTVSGSSNQLVLISGVTSRSYGYDASGNVLSDGTLDLTYNARNRLSHVERGLDDTDYLYDAVGQLIEATGTSGTVRFAYDDEGHLIGEYDASGDLIQETVWLGDTPVATIRPGSMGGYGFFYIHADQVNAPRRLVEPSNNSIVWRWDSDAFGNGAPDEDPDANSQIVIYNLRFPGQYYDSITGLHYNYFRDYDPSTGRYVESDPIGLRGGSNIYQYGNANPVQFFDQLGLAPGQIFSTPEQALADRESYRSSVDAHNIWWLTRLIGPQLVMVGPYPVDCGWSWDAVPLNMGFPPISRKPGKLGTFKGRSALRRENGMVRDAATAAGLNAEQSRRLHDEISGQGLSYRKILEIAMEIAGRY